MTDETGKDLVTIRATLGDGLVQDIKEIDVPTSETSNFIVSDSSVRHHLTQVNTKTATEDEAGKILDSDNINYELLKLPMKFEPEVNPQLEKEKELNNTWEFEGKEYPLMVIDGYYHSGIPINDKDKNHVADLVADFLIESKKPQPFFEHLELERKQVYNSKEDVTKVQSKNLNRQNVALYGQVVQSGQLIKYDTDGMVKSTEDRTRDQMMSIIDEYKSALIADWLNHFHVERFFPEGQGDAIDAILNPPDTIWLTAKIGDIKKPAHVLLFEFAAPGSDQRRDLEDAAFKTSFKDESDGRVTFTDINYQAKYAFARKWFRSISGVSILEPGKPFDKSKTHLEVFRANFNPHFWIRLADNLMDAFGYQKK